MLRESIFSSPALRSLPCFSPNADGKGPINGVTTSVRKDLVTLHVATYQSSESLSDGARTRKDSNKSDRFLDVHRNFDMGAVDQRIE